MRRPAWPGLALLVVALALAGELGLRYRDARQEVVRLEAQAGLVLSDARPARAVPKERLDEQAKGAEAVVRALTLPWAGLVAAIPAVRADSSNTGVFAATRRAPASVALAFSI